VQEQSEAKSLVRGLSKNLT